MSGAFRATQGSSSNATSETVSRLSDHRREVPAMAEGEAQAHLMRAGRQFLTDGELAHSHCPVELCDAMVCPLLRADPES